MPGMVVRALCTRGAAVAARRLLSSSATASTDVRAAVLRLAQQQSSSAAADLDSDLPTKFELLTACEREFGLVMPHNALNDVKSVDDIVDYWETRVAQVAEAEEAAAQHFTVAHPANVFIGGKGRGAEIGAWLREHAGHDAGHDDDAGRLEVLEDDDLDDEDEATQR